MKNKVRKNLTELHDELQSVDASDEESLGLLREVLTDIEHILEQAGDHPHEHETLAERLNDAALRFEGVHPRVADAVRALSNTLSGMGI